MILNNGQFYVNSIIRDETWPYILLVNGGPGQSCYGLETLIAHHGYFSTLKANIILYDQRGCGRSQKYQSYSHPENIADLETVIDEVQDQISQKIDLIIGHSYGAKILYDYLLAHSCQTKSMFVGTSSHLLIPRLNNLLLDLKYLQKSHPDAYEEFLTSFSVTDKKSIWEASEKLAPLFNLNPDRPLYYWANTQVRALMERVLATSPHPVNSVVFQQVRKDLYLGEDLLTFEFQRLNCPYRWVLGFFDYIMGGNLIYQSPNNQIIFDKSGHYPHLEENIRFCEVANEFLVS
jgi:proline iminopeptidase